ncbi:hypothetical protein HAX54_049331, partial [Datura stramonium]|nr:hypothetical protein [Datura stramonium]
AFYLASSASAATFLLQWIRYSDSGSRCGGPIYLSQFLLRHSDHYDGLSIAEIPPQKRVLLTSSSLQFLVELRFANSGRLDYVACHASLCAASLARRTSPFLICTGHGTSVPARCQLLYF